MNPILKLSPGQKCRSAGKMETKQCRKYGLNKSLLEFRQSSRNVNDARHAWCRACLNIYKKEWQNKPENREKQRLYQIEYRKTDKYKAYKREYSKTDKARKRLNKYQNKWKKTPAGKISNARTHHQRRSIIKSLPNTLTLIEWEEIIKKQNGRCAICGEVKPLEKDHIIPLSLGGSFTKENIQGLCRGCNMKKLNKMPKGWKEE